MFSLKVLKLQQFKLQQFKRNRFLAYCTLVKCFILFSYANVQAQHTNQIDSAYIDSFPNSIFLRTYYSQKFTGFHVDLQEQDIVLKYAPNTTRNLGVGFTYKWATLNLAYGFSFMNPDQGKGDTRYLDLQSHQYLGKWNIDFYGQFYRGYFLRNTPVEFEGKYLRPDLGVVEIGASIQYVFNHEKFSFKAAFLNTERQKKSAGTPFVGWDVFYGNVRADSTLVPFFYQQELSPEYNNLFFLKTGPLTGYAYTLVIKKHFYISNALSLHYNVGVYTLSEENVEQEEQGFFSLDVGLRSVIGYSSEYFNVSSSFVLQTVQISDNYKNILNTGNFRIIATYRLH